MSTTKTKQVKQGWVSYLEDPEQICIVGNPKGAMYISLDQSRQLLTDLSAVLEEVEKGV